MTRPASSAVAFLCDRSGIVREVLRDDVELLAGRVGEPFPSLASEDSVAAAFQLLNRARSAAVALDWTLTLMTPGGGRPYRVSVTAAGELFLVLAVSDELGVEDLLVSLAESRSELVDMVRSSFKALSMASRAEPSRMDAYDELMTMNNEMVALQRELARKNAELQRLDQLKNELLGTAAHDLRNPLAIIIGYTKILARAGSALDDRHREMLSRVEASAGYMLHLVSGLLDVSAIESGQLRLDVSRTDVGALVAAAVDLNREVAGDKGIELRFERAPEPLDAEVDPGKIEQVVHNLVTNAIKFSHPDTRVVVSIERRGDEVRVAVEDRGQGIPADQRDRLFRPFGRTSVRATAGEKSTGLGLAIARRIVEGHGGSIGVASEEGVGSTFHFTLPATEREAP